MIARWSPIHHSSPGRQRDTFGNRLMAFMFFDLLPSMRTHEIEHVRIDRHWLIKISLGRLVRD